MKKFIRSKESQKLLTEDWDWTTSFAEAWSFDNHDEATRIQRLLKNEELEIYYLFQEHTTSEYDFVISLRRAGYSQP